MQLVMIMLIQQYSQLVPSLSIRDRGKNFVATNPSQLVKFQNAFFGNSSQLNLAVLFYFHNELYSYCIIRVRNCLRGHQLLISNTNFLILIKKCLRNIFKFFNQNVKIWGTCIFLHFYLILVNVKRVIMCQSKDLVEKNLNYLLRTLNRVVYVHK